MVLRFWRMSEARVINPLLRGHYVYEDAEGRVRTFFWGNLNPILPLPRYQDKHSLPPHVVARLNHLMQATAAELDTDIMATEIGQLFQSGLAFEESVADIAAAIGRIQGPYLDNRAVVENTLEQLIATSSITRIERMMPEKVRRSEFYRTVAFDLSSKALALARQARTLVEGDA